MDFKHLLVSPHLLKVNAGDRTLPVAWVSIHCLLILYLGTSWLIVATH